MKKIKLLAFLINLFLVAIIICVFFTSCCVQTNPGYGKKIGRIVKISKNGLFYKTWEGELIRGGLNDGSGSMGGSFKFTIENSDLAYQAMDYMEKGQEVIIEYEIEFISSCTRSECLEPHFVKKINLVK